jgi:hypothetical protein
MIFVCKLPINKIKGYLYSILSLSGQSSGSPDNGPDKDSIENKIPFILYIRNKDMFAIQLLKRSKINF